MATGRGELYVISRTSRAFSLLPVNDEDSGLNQFCSQGMKSGPNHTRCDVSRQQTPLQEAHCGFDSQNNSGVKLQEECWRYESPLT